MKISTINGDFFLVRLHDDPLSRNIRLISTDYKLIQKISKKIFTKKRIERIESKDGDWAITIPESRACILLSECIMDIYYPDFSLEITKNEIDNSENREKKLIIEIGAEGGSISIHSSIENRQTIFFVIKNDCGASFLDDEDYEPPATTEIKLKSWSEVVDILDKNSWWLLYPVFLDEKYKEIMKNEIQKRGIVYENSPWKTILSKDDSW